MYNKKAFLYDLIYSFKDYKQETSILLEILKKHNVKPESSNVLEAACGTCNHMKYYAPNFNQVIGFDLNSEVIEIGKKKIEKIGNAKELFTFDMTDENLLNKLQISFQVILCLFGSIGHIFPSEKAEKVFKNFYALLSKNGIAIIEPFIDPNDYIPGYSDITTFMGDDIRIARMGKSKRKYKKEQCKDEEERNRLIVEFHYLITNHKKEGDPIEHFEEIHEMQMYTKEQFKCIAERIGFKVEFEKFINKELIVLKK